MNSSDSAPVRPVSEHPTPARSEAIEAERREARERRARRRTRRAIYSILAVAFVVAIGTIGFEIIVGFGWINAFYFESMLATGQGPPTALTSTAGKLFASAMAFLSVGTVITTLLLNVGPLLGRLWREGLEDVEHRMRRLEAELRGRQAESPKPPIE